MNTWESSRSWAEYNAAGWDEARVEIRRLIERMKARKKVILTATDPKYSTGGNYWYFLDEEKFSYFPHIYDLQEYYSRSVNAKNKEGAKRLKNSMIVVFFASPHEFDDTYIRVTDEYKLSDYHLFVPDSLKCTSLIFSANLQHISSLYDIMFQIIGQEIDRILRGLEPDETLFLAPQSVKEAQECVAELREKEEKQITAPKKKGTSGRGIVLPFKKK